MQIVRAALASISAVLTLSLLPACSFFVHTVADPIAQRQVKRLKLPNSRVEEFSACLQGAGGVCTKPASPISSLMDSLTGESTSVVTSRKLSTKTATPRTALVTPDGRRIPRSVAANNSDQDNVVLQAGALAAEKARQVLNSPVQEKLNSIFNAARFVSAAAAEDRLTNPQDPGVIVIDVREFDKYMTMVEEATSADGWAALDRESAFSDTDAEDQIRRKYIAAYFKAYFRNGKFYSVKLNGDELRAKVVARLKDSVPGIPKEGSTDPYEALAEKLFSELKFDKNGQQFIGKIAAQSFVTRGGQELKFPAVEAELFLASGKAHATTVDYVAVGADLIRVLLHAVYDAHDRIPGINGATGYLVTPALAEYDPLKSRVDADEFEQIETRAAQVEASTSGAVGRVIRGLGLVALNNEALATAIETAVGVAVRKHTEKVLWCWAACELNVSPQKDGADVAVPEEVNVDVAITGEPSKVIGVARSTR